MSAFPKYDEHERLLNCMAETLGIDLEAEQQAGDFTPSDRDDAVYRCVSCTNPEGCKTWLAQYLQADTPPEFCRNTSQLSALKKG